MDRPRGMLQARRAVRSLVAANVLLGTLVAGATIAIMALLASVVSRVFLQHASLTQVWPSLWWLLAAVACRAALVAVQELVAHQTARRFTRSLRQELFAHLLLLGPAYTTAETTGELAATVTEGIERLEPYVARYLPHRVLCVTVPALLLVAVFTQDWVSGAILLATAPILPLLMVLVGTYAKGHIDRQWSALSRMHAYFLDALQGLPTLKQYGRSGAERRRMAAVSRAFQSLTMRVLGYAFLSALVLEFITAGAIALVAVELGTRLLDGGISFERAFFILLLTPDYFRPLRELGAHRHAAMEGTPVLERIAQILSTPMRGRAGQPPLAPHITLPAHALTVSLHDLTFTYPGFSPPALKGVSLELLPGTRTAVVGRSGAGKSTLVNLLLRFIEPDSGEITADGVPLVSLSAARWREYVALVPQRPYLFAGTVYENIALGRQGASRREVERAASLAGAAEFVEHLPLGYETEVGERGNLLSGGEAQRIAIARAFLKDAPVLILDEPTSSLDPTTEALIRDALERLMRDRTVLIVAHRLNTIYTADQIAVLDQGRLVELGRHDDLLRRDGSYSTLVRAGTGERV